MSAIVSQKYMKAAEAQPALVSILAKAFKAASSPLNMGLTKDQPWVGIGTTAAQDVFYKVQLVRDLTKAEEAALPKAHEGIPVKYKRSWMSPNV